MEFISDAAVADLLNAAGMLDRLDECLEAVPYIWEMGERRWRKTEIEAWIAQNC